VPSQQPAASQQGYCRAECRVEIRLKKIEAAYCCCSNTYDNIYQQLLQLADLSDLVAQRQRGVIKKILEEQSANKKQRSGMMTVDKCHATNESHGPLRMMIFKGWTRGHKRAVLHMKAMMKHSRH